MTKLEKARSSVDSRSNTMKDESQIIAIAEQVGFNWIHPHHSTASGDEKSLLLVLTKEKRYHSSLYESYLEGRFIGRDVPNYLNDLNAMHEAEKVLTEAQLDAYAQQVYTIVARENPIRRYGIHATASQRAEAFLRIIGKWDESPAPLVPRNASREEEGKT